MLKRLFPVVIGRDDGHNPQIQAFATPETDKELSESGQDTGSDAGGLKVLLLDIKLLTWSEHSTCVHSLDQNSSILTN